MTLIRRIGRLRGFVDKSRDLAARARVEVMNHAHNDCVVGRQIFLAAWLCVACGRPMSIALKERCTGAARLSSLLLILHHSLPLQ